MSSDIEDTIVWSSSDSDDERFARKRKSLKNWPKKKTGKRLSLDYVTRCHVTPPDKTEGAIFLESEMSPVIGKLQDEEINQQLESPSLLEHQNKLLPSKKSPVIGGVSEKAEKQPLESVQKTLFDSPTKSPTRNTQEIEEDTSSSSSWSENEAAIEHPNSEPQCSPVPSISDSESPIKKTFEHYIKNWAHRSLPSTSGAKEPEDHANMALFGRKRRSKLPVGSLAHQFDVVMRKTLADISLWKHEVSLGNNPEEESSTKVTLKILKYSKKYSIHELICAEEDGVVCTVLIAQEFMSKRHIEVGMQIYIYEPYCVKSVPVNGETKKYYVGVNRFLLNKIDG